MGTYYDIPSLTVDYGNSSICKLTAEDTGTMPLTTYTVLYEQPVLVNGKYFKDVSWINNKLESSFSHISSVDESGRQGPEVLRDLQNMLDTNAFNTYTIDYVELQEPVLSVRTLERTGENLYTVAGTTNFADKTDITIKVDEEYYYALRETAFIYHTRVMRPSDTMMGNWNASLRMPIQEMAPGWHNLSVIVGDLKTTARFHIDEQEWAPSATPTQYVKYLSNGQIAPVIVTIVQPPVVVTQTVEIWHTATPTPAMTDAMGEEIGYPYTYGDKIPKEIVFLILGGFAGLILVRTGMKRWKK
jgi:hypothetical protein